MSPGDTLIVCSDGVSDPVYAAGSDFEFEVLEALRRDRYASAFEISQSILSVTQGPAPYTEDDRTLVVVRFSDTGLAHDLPRCAACVAA